MNKSNVLVLFSFVIVGAAIINAVFLQDSEALYSIPPTPAWTTIEINNNATLPMNPNRTEVTAINSNDRLFLISDGSILINITEYRP